MPHIFPMTEHLHGFVGRTPSSAAGPLAGFSRGKPLDSSTKSGSRGPAQTRGSAPRTPRHSRCWENYVALGRSAAPHQRRMAKWATRALILHTARSWFR